MLQAIGTILVFAGQVGLAYLAFALFMRALIAAHDWVDARQVSYVSRKRASSSPTSDESLDDVFNRLKRAAGPNFIDPVRESRLAEMADPTIHAPTDETRAVYLEHLRSLDKARRRKIRRERIARVKAFLLRTCRSIVRYFKSIGN